MQGEAAGVKRHETAIDCHGGAGEHVLASEHDFAGIEFSFRDGGVGVLPHRGRQRDCGDLLQAPDDSPRRKGEARGLRPPWRVDQRRRRIHGDQPSCTGLRQARQVPVPAIGRLKGLLSERLQPGQVLARRGG